MVILFGRGSINMMELREYAGRFLRLDSVRHGSGSASSVIRARGDIDLG